MEEEAAVGPSGVGEGQRKVLRIELGSLPQGWKQSQRKDAPVCPEGLVAHLSSPPPLSLSVTARC